MNNLHDEDILRNFAESNETIEIDKNIKETKTESKKSSGNVLGWQTLDITSFPSKGLFYPDGTKIYVRAATAGEIKHWSTMNIEKT